MDKDYSGTPSTNDPGGGSTSVGSTSNTMGHKDILGGGSTNDDPFLSTDDPGGGRHPVRSPSNTMDNKDNLDDGSTNDDPGFRGNSNTSNTQQAASDTHESRVSPYLVTRDPSLKPAGAVTNTMDKDGLWCGGLRSCGKGRAMCNCDDYCGG